MSSEYGWTDEQILDLTMSRLRQAREVAMERLIETYRRNRLDRQHELRVVCSFVAGSAGHAKGQQQAMKITLITPPDGKRELRYVPAENVERLFDG